MGHFQSSLIIRDLHNYKGVPYGHGVTNQKLRLRDSLFWWLVIIFSWHKPWFIYYQAS